MRGWKFLSSRWKGSISALFEALKRTFNSEKFSRPTRVCSQAARQRILDAATSGQLLTTSALPKIGSGIEADLSLAEERSAASAGCGGGLPTRHAGGSGRPFGHLSAPPMSFLLEGEGEKRFYCGAGQTGERPNVWVQPPERASRGSKVHTRCLHASEYMIMKLRRNRVTRNTP